MISPWLAPAPPRPPVPLPPQVGPTGLLRLHVQRHMHVWPYLWVGGFFVPLRFGTHDIPLIPGPWSVEIAIVSSYRWYGQASQLITVRPSEVVELWYAGPWHPWTVGSLGPVPQQRRGLRGWLVWLLISLIVPVALVASFFVPTILR